MSEVLQNPTENWRWNAKKTRAAVLLAEDELTDSEIADDVGVHRDTISAWKRSPEFSAKVAEHVAEIGDRAARYAIARKTRRVAVLNDRWERMRKVIEERGAAPEMQAVPGGATGLLVHTHRSVGSGPAQQIVDEYAFDAALVKELREAEKQAAQELGQWVEKQEVGGQLIHTIEITHDGVPEGRVRDVEVEVSPGADAGVEQP